MSDKTDYKRLWKGAREAGLKYREMSQDCLKAINDLLNWVKPKLSPEDFQQLLAVIGAEERKPILADKKEEK